MASLDCKNGTVHKNQKRKDNCTICSSNSDRQEIESVDCEKCGKTNISLKTIKYHKCIEKFSYTAEDAWEGDALHRLNVIRFLRSQGYKKNISNTLLLKFVEARSQASFLLQFGVIDESITSFYSYHKISTIFEGLYLKNPDFRYTYDLLCLSEEFNIILNDELPLIKLE